MRFKLKASSFLYFCFICLLVFTMQSSVEAAAKKKEPVEKQPITVYADYVHYEQESGELFAEGNVRVIQEGQTILADRMDGNTKTGDIWTNTRRLDKI